MEQRLLLLAQAAMDRGDPKKAATYLAAADVREPKWYLLYGQALLEQKAYGEAAQALQVVENQFHTVCLPALEVCYREMGNFEMAYRYACKAREQK